MAYDNAFTELLHRQMAAVQLIAPIDFPHDFTIQSMSGMTSKSFMMMKAAVRLSGRTILSLIYDVSGDTPTLGKVWMMSRSTDPEAIARGDDLTLLVDCTLWAPVGDGPIVIVAPAAYGGYFAMSADGTRLEHRQGKPARQLAAGTARAKQRIMRAALSGDLEPRGGTTLLLAA